MEQGTRCSQCGQPLGKTGVSCPKCKGDSVSGRDASVRLGLLALALGVVLYVRHRHWIHFGVLVHSVMGFLH